MKFWEGKRVLVTGHTGFKGGWLSLWLQKLDANVFGYSLPAPTELNLFTAANVASGMVSVIGDICNLTDLQAVMDQYSPEIVFHLAAQPLVRYSYKEPIQTYATNVMGTLHLLEAVRKTESVKVVINVTSDKCYENTGEHRGYRETDRLGGHDPYSNSKACSELVTTVYQNSYFSSNRVGLASARAGNVIGGGDWALDRLLPDIMRGFINRNTVIIRNPHSVRPWQHVLEPLSGYLLLAEHLYENPTAFSEGWNFGPHGQDIQTVGAIADHLVALWGAPAWQQHQDDNILHEAQILALDSAKAKEKLGWQPRWNLKKALTETVSWYQAYIQEQEMRKVTLQQITQFEEQG